MKTPFTFTRSRPGRRVWPRSLRQGALGAALTVTLTACPATPITDTGTTTGAAPSSPGPAGGTASTGAPPCNLTPAAWAAIEAPGNSAARVWDELALNAIRSVLPQPAAHARNLFHLSAAMYDTWAAFDPTAQGVFVQETHQGTPAQVELALNRAAHRVLRARYAGVVPALGTCFDDRLRHLGLDPADTGTQGGTPAATGNRIAQTILDAARMDGANEAQGYADTTGYRAVNGPLRPEIPGATPSNPDRWQPLLLKEPFTQNGIPLSGPQTFMGAQWGSVKPFAMTRNGRFYHDPGPVPSISDPLMAARWVPDLLRRQAQLDPARPDMTDLSPAVTGNHPLGTNNGRGHPLNPVTGQPYAPNPTKLADYGRVIAEFWADGPRAETPPGHWNVLANAVSDDARLAHRLGGQSPTLPRLEWDVKLYLALNAAMHDAAIAAWDVKRQSDTARPITLVRVLAARQALPDEAGVTEERGGKLLARSFNPAGGFSWRDPADWIPYQTAVFVSPAFPGFVSGHSTFSRAAASVLTDLTGSGFFPGGLYEMTAAPGFIRSDSSTNATPVRLQWATYADAADQAGQSRIWGGIHIEPDDLAGRRIGQQVGLDAVALARRYFTGQAP
ncbi:vanadium-dependent haloperoxidase [Deinococcus aquaticus]|uniref:vanadium-dependent haloperoxidase n=1 Tax=Deinococcus aquaticus TaxID=328692 RepID=UPI003F448937